MRRMFWNFRHWLRRLRHPPAVVISRSGQRTSRPQVHVSVAGVNGSQGVYTWDSDAVGEARATQFGRGLAQIMQRRLIDERESVSLADPSQGGNALLELLGTLILCALILIVAIPMNSASCRAEWRNSGMRVDYGLLSGCRVSKDGKTWIPADRWREVNE